MTANPVPIHNFQQDGASRDLEMVKVGVQVKTHHHTYDDPAQDVVSDDQKVVYNP